MGGFLLHYARRHIISQHATVEWPAPNLSARLAKAQNRSAIVDCRAEQNRSNDRLWRNLTVQATTERESIPTVQRPTGRVPI